MTDERAELRREIRKLARARGLEPRAGLFSGKALEIEPHPVIHTSHPTYGYLVQAGKLRIVWAPEFLEFPPWARGADLMLAEASGWDRPILFARAAGGHAPALEVARQAKEEGVRRLILAHIGRPTIRAIDAGEELPFGEFGVEGKVHTLRGCR